MEISLKNSIASLIEKRNQIHILEKEIKTLTSSLMKEHERQKLDFLCEDGYTSSLLHASRKTPDVKKIEERFRIKIPDDCFKITEYKSLKTAFVNAELSGTNALLNESN